MVYNAREMFDYVIRPKRVGVRAESLSSEKRLRTAQDLYILFHKILQVFSYSYITRSESLLNSNPYYMVLVSLA